MKTIVATLRSFGPAENLEFIENETPKPGPQEFLLKGQFAGVSTGDVRVRSKNVPRGFKFIMGFIFGFSKPKFESLGTDYAGEVIHLGESVEGLNLGERVVVDTGMGMN